MLQPVLPYALVGLGVGSLSKRPYMGALIGSLVGVFRTGSGADDPDFGNPFLALLMTKSDSPGASKVVIPSKVTDLPSARLASAVALVNSGHT